MTNSNQPDPARLAEGEPPESAEGGHLAGDRHVRKTRPARATAPPEPAPIAAEDGDSAGRNSQPQRPEGKVKEPPETATGSGRPRTAKPASQGASRDRAEPTTRPIGPGPKTYEVDFQSVLDGLMFIDAELLAEFSSFKKARRYAVECLEEWGDDLNQLVDKLRAAEDFGDLDLGWHLPLLQEYDELEV